jgi:phage terminase large subunit-like protein
MSNQTTNSKINPHILRYMEMVESGEIKVCEEQHDLMAHICKCFETEDIYTNDEQLEKYLGLSKYFPYEKIFEWEEFVLALHCCTYRTKDDMPRWPDLFMLVGRGAGKDGYIAYESFCLSSEHNGIKNYDVDICANNEDQAMRPLKDVIEALEQPHQIAKMRKFFYWNKEEAVNLKTKSIIKGRTNSPKGKDGLRSGIVIFNEIHQYQDYANINVFTTGLGKKKHPRRTYATTNGDVRDGPLDDKIKDSLEILEGDMPDNGMLPFICRLDDKEEVNDPTNWEKANPSLRYLPNLLEEVSKEYKDWKANPNQFTAFMTKRMNIPEGNKDVQVTEWENILATNKPIPDLTGKDCTVGIDYASISDMCSVNFHFKDGDKRYDISHAWLCLNSADITRIKAPWREWAKDELITLVDDVEISPDLITSYIQELGAKYNILGLALDNYRYALLANSLRKIGFDAKEYKNVHMIRPSDIMKTVPVVGSYFANHNFIWGDNSPLRWATNNTKLVRAGKTQGTDTGNYYFCKVEGRSRKTDSFLALVASIVIEDRMGDGEVSVPDLPVFTY